MLNIKIKENYQGKTIIYPLFQDRLNIPLHQENLDNLIKGELFKGEKGSSYRVSLICQEEFSHLIFVGLGKSSEEFMESLRQAVGTAFKEAKNTKKQTVGI